LSSPFRWLVFYHQADVLHAYNLLTTKGGIPASNVVLMMYDDIANDPSNPFPGNIINKPNGTNLYTAAVQANKDYTGEQVTAANFLSILSGNATAMKGIGSGKVIASGPNDHVFVFFSDHGAAGLVAMPSGPYLYATDLQNTLNGMIANKQFKQLVFYLESCESGSMFDGLLGNNTNIWATTAATPDQSSYAFYYDDTRGTYLGDEYSVHWMEDSDVEPFATYSLKSQFVLLQKVVLQSQPQLYGQMSMGNLPVGLFQGNSGARARGLLGRTRHIGPQKSAGSVDSRDVKLALLKHRLLAAKTQADRVKFAALVQAEIRARERTDATFAALVEGVTGSLDESLLKFKYLPRDFECLKASVNAFENKCGRLSDYALKYVKVLANLCEEQHSKERIAETMLTLNCN
jgi:legumain